METGADAQEKKIHLRGTVISEANDPLTQSGMQYYQPPADHSKGNDSLYQ